MAHNYRITSLPDLWTPSFPGFDQETACKVRAFHETFPQYTPTPLVTLSDTAKALGLGAVYVKDESFRFGLNAFKVLGGSYAIGRILAQRAGLEESAISHRLLTSPIIREQLGTLTFVTATDGNHGRGVAWAAREFGHNSVVYMPKGSVQIRLDNIRLAGAQASITDLCYDDAVRLARKMAEQEGWLIVQDTGWAGYEQIPQWIMQGYTTMGLEAWEQLPEKPTHIFLQAGVGSMAAAIAALFCNLCGDEKPVITIVEPLKADCFFRTAKANDGRLHTVTESMDTIMAGLACGEPCPDAWKILRQSAMHYIACPDSAAVAGMRLLARPCGKDQTIVSGESGASAFGCVSQIMALPELKPLRQQLGLDNTSKVLFFSTEGDTDPDNYRTIIR